MKKIITFILIALMCLSVFASGWEKIAYTDDFGDETGSYYLRNIVTCTYTDNYYSYDKPSEFIIFLDAAAPTEKMAYAEISVRLFNSYGDVQYHYSSDSADVQIKREDGSVEKISFSKPNEYERDWDYLILEEAPISLMTHLLNYFGDVSEKVVITTTTGRGEKIKATLNNTGFKELLSELLGYESWEAVEVEITKAAGKKLETEEKIEGFSSYITTNSLGRVQTNSDKSTLWVFFTDNSYDQIKDYILSKGYTISEESFAYIGIDTSSL